MEVDHLIIEEVIMLTGYHDLQAHLKLAFNVAVVRTFPLSSNCRLRLTVADLFQAVFQNDEMVERFYISTREM